MALHINGIEWTSARHRNGLTFHHNDFSVVTDDRGVTHVAAGNGPIFSDKEKAVCLKEATAIVLDSYAAEFIPMWDEP